MPNLGNMLAAAQFFAAAARRVSGAEREGLGAAAKIIEDGARDAIGTYEFGWPPLAESTLARKGADTPLLETGELKASISSEVHETSAIVGSTSDLAPYHEFGTSRGIPPRPFIYGSWIHHEKEAVEAAGDVIVKRLGL